MNNNTIIDLDLSNKDGAFRNSYFTLDIIKNGLCPYIGNPHCLLNFLNIYGCNIGPKGLKLLVQALKKNKTLIYLNIGDNKLQDT